jgi:tetratricopeptide (TPR) repeat protein
MSNKEFEKSKQIDSPEIASASPSMPKKTGKNWLVLLLIVAVIASASLWWISQIVNATPKVPKPDFTTANSNVAIATAQLLKAVEEKPNSAGAWGQYGEILMAHEWNSEALICFDQAAKLNPKEMRWPYLAAILLDRQEPTLALAKYDIAKELASGYAPLWIRRGNTLLGLNRNDDAESSFKKAFEADKNQPFALIALARIAGIREDWKKSTELLEQAKSIAPKNREVLVELTRSRMLLGVNPMLGQAEQSAILSGQRYETMPDEIYNSINEREVAARFAAMQADSAAAKGDLQAAAEGYVALIKQRPEMVRPRLNLASVFLQSGQAPLALTTLKEAVQLFPEDARAHYAYSYALEGSQQLEAARREREEAVRLKPDFAEAHFALAISAERDGDMDQAIQSYRLAIQSDARLARAHLGLGLALQKQGKLVQAVAAMDAAVKLSPGDPVPKGYLDKAKALLEKNRL